VSIDIPCTPAGNSYWSQRTTIAGRNYQLTFLWSQRAGAWSLSIADQDGSPILSGITLVAGYPLTSTLDARLPPGLLVVDDTLGLFDVDPGFSDLGDRFRLVYFSPDEIT
jgi:hypothetical protein